MLEEIEKLKTQLSEQRNEIEELRNALAEYEIYKCCLCSKYETDENTKTCVICIKDFCLDCVICCHDCDDYYCPPCFVIDTGNSQTRHYTLCPVCQAKDCVFDDCDLCGEIVCSSCYYYCGRHNLSSCLSCQPECSNENSRCRQCHLEKCGLCWKPAEFKFLSFHHQTQILTLLFVFKYMTPSNLVPPKFIKYIIFRHLVHPDPTKLTCVTRRTPNRSQ